MRINMQAKDKDKNKDGALEGLAKLYEVNLFRWSVWKCKLD